MEMTEVIDPAGQIEDSQGEANGETATEKQKLLVRDALIMP